MAALKANNYIPHEPFERQKEFLALDCFEALYGGAAGGGKSDAILMAAAQYIHVPGYAALILRRTYADLALEDAIMWRAQRWWLGVDGITWSATDKRFTFPSGATITFGYLDAEVDKFRYQGAAFQFIGFDELTQFTETKYTYLLSRVRRLANADVPLRVRGASNPGGIGHDWVFKRFVDAKTAVAPFVPAMLVDNYHLDRESYGATLDLLDPVTREQLKKGVWIRGGGGLVYGEFREHRNLIDMHEIPKLDTHLLALDFGVVDENALTVIGWRANDFRVFILRSYRLTGLVGDVAAEIGALDKQYHFVKVVGDIGGMGKLFQQELLSRFSIHVEAADKANKYGYVRLMNNDLAGGNILVAYDGVACEDLTSEWVELPWDEKRLKEHPGFKNHAADSALYGWRASLAYHERPIEKKPAVGTEEAYRLEAEALEAAAIADIARQEEEEREDIWG